MNVVPTSRCPICRGEYLQFSSFNRGCSAECRAEFRRQKERKKVAAAERRERRAALVKLRTVSDWTVLAQAEFNKFIRERDKFLPCVSCDVENPPERFVGGVWDCGHFRTVGAAAELRFEEFNAAKQCKSCNGGRVRKRDYIVPLEAQISVRARFRERLVERIGIEKVEWLEGPHEPKRYRIEELIGIRDKYRAKTKALRFQRENSALMA